MLNMSQPSCLATSNLQTKTTYKVEDFPSFEVAKSYGFTVELFERFKNMFLGKPVPQQTISDDELAWKGYSCWPNACLLEALAIRAHQMLLN